MKQIKEKKSWNRIYAKTLEASFVLSLALLISVFFSFQVFNKEYSIPKPPSIGPTIVIDVPITTQLRIPPLPTRPSIPVAADEDDIIDDVTIDYGKYAGAMDLEAPPPEPDDNLYQFFQVSEKPEIIKRVKPIYPKTALRAGITGTVTVTVLIGKKGDVEDVKILKESLMLTEAAVAAAWKCKFKPAKQRDKFVKVWMSVPFEFKLK